MKRLEELGISPTPWEMCSPTKNEVVVVALDDQRRVVDVALCRAPSRLKDAHLTSTSPMLYDCLFEAVERVCSRCYDYRNGKCRSNRTEDSCYAKRWREVLEKAGGERVENVNETEQL